MNQISNNQGSTPTNRKSTEEKDSTFSESNSPRTSKEARVANTALKTSQTDTPTYTYSQETVNKEEIRKTGKAVASFFNFILGGFGLFKSGEMITENKINEIQQKISQITNSSSELIQRINRNEEFSTQDVDDVSNLAKSTQTTIDKFNKLLKNHVKFIIRHPKSASLKDLQALSDLSSALDRLSTGTVSSSIRRFIRQFDEDTQKIVMRKPFINKQTQNPNPKPDNLTHISKRDQSNILTACCSNENGKSTYDICINDNQPISDDSEKPTDNTVQGGLAKDFNRSPPSHIFYTKNNTTQEIIITKIDKKVLDPLIDKKTKCIEFINSYETIIEKTPADYNELIKLVKNYNSIVTESEKISCSAEELKNKKNTILKSVSLILNETLNNMDTHVKDSLYYKEMIHRDRVILYELNQNEKLGLLLTEPVENQNDREKKADIKLFLRKMGFNISTESDLNLSEELAYQILSNFPDLNPSQKSALLQAIRSTSTQPALKALNFFGRPIFNQENPHNINIILNQNGNVFVKHQFKIELHKEEEFSEENTNSQKRIFSCELTLNINENNGIQNITEEKTPPLLLLCLYRILGQWCNIRSVNSD